MKKLFFTLIALVLSIGYCSATKVYADLSKAKVSGSNSSWDSETNTLSWTQSYSNSVDLNGLPTGDLSAYTKIVLVTSDLKTSDSYRLLVYYGDGSKNVAKEFYSVGTKEVDLAGLLGDNIKSVTRFCLAGKGSSGSVKLSAAYVVKPFSLEFDDTGSATVYPSDLTVQGGTYDEQTGLFKGDGTVAVKISIDLPAEGVNLTGLTGFKVNYSDGTLPVSNFTVKSGEWSKDFYNNVGGRSDLNQFFTGNATAVTSWEWNGSKTSSSVTISSITLQSNVITALGGHETLLTANMFNTDAALNTNTQLNNGAVIFGLGNSSVNADNYADLSAYDKVIVHTTPNNTNIVYRVNYTGSENATALTVDGDGIGTIEKPASGDFKLNSIKTGWNGTTVTVYSITLYKNDVDTLCSYKLAGTGVSSASAKAALADAAATSYDATGLTGSGITLTVANPNAIILANSGAVSNSDNVVVSSAAASLALQAGYPFAAPQAFTATKASLKASVSAAGAATFIAPFAVAIPSGVKAYTLAANGNDITATEVTGTIPANTPVLLNAAEGTYDFTATNASVGTDATGAKDALTGVYAATTVAQGSYVLQNGKDGIGFYKVASDDIVLKPFQAYLTTTSSAAKLAIVFGQTTGIESMHNSNFTTQNAGAVYNLAGQRVGKSYKGIVIVNGKKTIRK